MKRRGIRPDQSNFIHHYVVTIGTQVLYTAIHEETARQWALFHAPDDAVIKPYPVMAK